MLHESLNCIQGKNVVLQAVHNNILRTCHFIPESYSLIGMNLKKELFNYPFHTHLKWQKQFILINQSPLIKTAMLNIYLRTPCANQVLNMLTDFVSFFCFLFFLFPPPRYSNIACELLTCDVGVINDKLGNEETLLENLYAFLEQPSPLNPLLASFFSKTIGNLIARKTEQVISVHSYCNNNAENHRKRWL